MKLKNFTQKDRYGNMTSYDFYESDDNMGVPEMQGIPQHPGGPKGTDTVPAWLTPGEFVMNAEATRMFEPQIEQMNNAGRAVQAQQGGTIPEYAADGGQMPAAKMDGNTFAKAAMAVGLPTDNATLNKLVNLVNQGMSVQEAAKRIASVPQYSANGGPVYLAEGSGGFFDKLLNMFSNDETPKVPAATQAVVPPSSSSRADRVANLVNAAKTDGPTRPDPTMSNQMYMDFLKKKEGFRNEAYLDSAGVPTIGYGFTEGVQMGDTIDEKTANDRLLKEMAKTDQDYNKLVTADLNPNQQAAVKSLLYNIGGPQFANSKARAALNTGDFESFKKEAAEFRMADGKVIPGLENRRRDELELFFKPYKADRPDTSNAPMSMVSPEEQATFQRDVEAAQKATREQGMYDPDGNMEAIQTGIDQAQILEDQRRMQQGQKPVPSMIGAAVPPKPTDDPLVSTVPPSNTSRDDRVDVLNNAAKGGNTVIGTLQGNDVYQDDLGEYINTPEGPVYLDGNQLQAMTKAPASVPSSSTVPAVPPSNTSRDDRVSKLTDAATVPSASSNTEVPLPDDDIFSTPAMSTDPTASMLARQQALGLGPKDVKQPDVNVTLNQGEYGVNDTIIREDANGNPITYKWDSSKDAYVDNEGLEYNRGIGERVSGLFKSETVENAEPETGDTQIGTLNGNPVYMGQDGKPYVMEDLEVLGTSAGVQKMNIQPWQTDDIKMLPKENRPVAGPKTPSPKDKDGLVPLPMDTSIPDELSGTPMDSSAGVPKLEEAPPPPTVLPDELQPGQEMDSNKGIALKEVIKKTEGDNTTTGQTGEAATKAGETAPPEQIDEAESFLSGIFGDLFDADELKRMAIMYVGSRVMGGSHTGSMNFAAKQYVNRVDAKAAEKKALAKEERLDKKAARKEFNKNVFKLETERNFSPKSIKAWKDSYDPKTGTADSSLLSAIVKPSPMNIEGPAQLWYPEGGGKPILGITVKVGNKETGTTTMVIDPKTREQIPTYLYHQDRSRVKNTDEYKAAYQKDSAIYTTMLADLQAKQFKPGNKAANTEDYRPTDITASVSGPNIAKWQRDHGVDPSLMPQILESAYANMVASGQKRTADEGKSVKHKNIEKFLDGAYMPALVGDGSIFNVPGKDKPGDFKRISELTNNLVRQARANPKQDIKPTAKDHEVAKHIYTQLKNEFLNGSYSVPDPDRNNPNETKMQNIWTDEESKADFLKEAEERNISAFELFIEQKQKAYNRKPV